MDEIKIHAVGQIAELLNNTLKVSHIVDTSDYSRKEVVQNHLFDEEEVKLIKRKLLKILTEI